MTENNIARMMASSGHGDVILDDDDGIYEKGDEFKSFHLQASQPMSRKALLVGFLSICLNKYVLSSPPHDEILLFLPFTAVHLVYE